jgi:transketolase
MTYTLWDKFLRHNPYNPSWINRDRFILSAGHGSALLYSLLHLNGYDLSLDELKQFRQWGSKTPGHPEYGLTSGVEATTGPLGQGFAMGVGMALAESFLSNCFNMPNYPIVDNNTYAIVSDGDLMEGISYEAASLAGTLKLHKMIYLYDDNHITIEGKTDTAFTENVKERFSAYNWRVFHVPDGNDLISIEKAISNAQNEKSKPSIIIIRTHIGYGSPKVDSASVHGEPLGQEALITTKKNLGWPIDPSFHIPDKSLEHFRKSIQKGIKIESEWKTLFEKYQKDYPDLASQFKKVVRGEIPVEWKKGLPAFNIQEKPIATRNASGKVMNALTNKIHALGNYHFLVGGSADLAPSTKTLLVGYGDFGFGNYCSHNVHYGIREHAMGAIANGIALYSGMIPYTATFLIFSDYMRPAIRLSALMKTHVIFVFTHDSIGLGEDGPTHQPIEHLVSLRTIPGLTLIRPADANETSAAWQIAIERKGPMALILTRQKLPILDHQITKEGLPRGAYILEDSESNSPDIILIGTGSEVHLAIESSIKLDERGISSRVVSMPSWEIFDEQPEDYKKKILPQNIPKLAIEAGTEIGWCKYVGENGDAIGLNRFGASAPGNIVYNELGFNKENVIQRAIMLLNKEKLR